MNLVFVGVGGAGCKLANRLYNNKTGDTYKRQCVFIDFDVASLEETYSGKDKNVLFPDIKSSSSGAGRSRIRAQYEYDSNRWEELIIDTIDDLKLDDETAVFVLYSASGGTGSGIGPLVAGVFARKVSNPVTTVIALHNTQDGQVGLVNTKMALSEHKFRGNNTVMLIRPTISLKDIDELNEIFDDEFWTYIQLGHTRYIDHRDILTSFKSKGAVTLMRLIKDEKSEGGIRQSTSAFYIPGGFGKDDFENIGLYKLGIVSDTELIDEEIAAKYPTNSSKVVKDSIDIIGNDGEVIAGHISISAIPTELYMDKVLNEIDIAIGKSGDINYIVASILNTSITGINSEEVNVMDPITRKLFEGSVSMVTKLSDEHSRLEAERVDKFMEESDLDLMDMFSHMGSEDVNMV